MTEGLQIFDKMEYKDEFLVQIEKLTLCGFDIGAIADFYLTTKEIVFGWIEQSPELNTAIANARIMADSEVANSLFRKATGFTIKEQKVFISDGTPITVEVDKYFPPDTLAAKYWLNNRQPELWKEKATIDINETKKFEMGNLSNEELKLLEHKLSTRQHKGE